MRVLTVIVSVLFLFSVSLEACAHDINVKVLLGKENYGLVSLLSRLISIDTGKNFVLHKVPITERGSVLQDMYEAKGNMHALAAVDTSVFPEILKKGYGLSSFTYVYPLARNPYVIVTRNDFSWKDISEFINAGKKVDNRVTIGVVDETSTSRIIGESIVKLSKIKFLLVYMSDNQKLIDSIMTGKIGTAILPLSWVYPKISLFKRIKILAVVGDGRARVIPAVPTLKEQHMPGVPNGDTIFLISSRKLVVREVGGLRKCIQKATSDPEWKSFLSSRGYEPLSSDINYVTEYTSREFAKVKKVFEKK